MTFLLRIRIYDVCIVYCIYDWYSNYSVFFTSALSIIITWIYCIILIITVTALELQALAPGVLDLANAEFTT